MAIILQETIETGSPYNLYTFWETFSTNSILLGITTCKLVHDIVANYFFHWVHNQYIPLIYVPTEIHNQSVMQWFPICDQIKANCMQILNINAVYV